MKMSLWEEFHGPNAGYVIELYERFLQDPDSVDADTRAQFETLVHEAIDSRLQVIKAIPATQVTNVVAAANLAQAIRAYGHLAARLDPLGAPPRGDPSIDASYHGLVDQDLAELPAEIVGGPIVDQASSALEAVQILRSVYTSRIGYDYEHVHNPQEREWLRFAAECGRLRPPEDPVDPVPLLERLTQIEVFERFLHRTFPGKTRFSIEGLDMLVPMLDTLIEAAAKSGVCMVMLGMAHRGRLNVLAHVLHKPYEKIMAEFKDTTISFTTRNELGWTGDVKYHKGGGRAVTEEDMVKLVVQMPSNPSHLEHINPVLEGMARAAGSKVDKPGSPQFFPEAALPILIHGDAAFPGEGIVPETINFSRMEGYHVGGTVHIIANNQLGFTTSPNEGRSTYYASDLAKGFNIPVIHVNADDPIACLEAARTAFEYRAQFKKDFLIDLVGYRRYGHNEGDEPGFTQPVMYRLIDEHPSVRQIWAQGLVEKGLLESSSAEQMVHRQMGHLQKILDGLSADIRGDEPQLEPPPAGEARRVKTTVPLEELKQLNHALLDVPPDFAIHRKLERAMQRRREVLDHPDRETVDWTTAEHLAFASILADGVPIRLTGQDVERGTFSQRHAVLHSLEGKGVYIPLQNIPQARAAFEVLNSPLSENAALGFEYGYNLQFHGRLVVWEAQYGDFANAAQAIIDEFLVSGRAKWEHTCSLVLLLPHGYEGQGPDHSSGRPERFLQLSAENNLRLANCTTAAQYFHLLRRQAALLKSDPLPLVILTPKSLLRHPLVASPPRALAEGSWQPVIDDPQIQNGREQIRRLILCSGKIYVDLHTSEHRPQRDDAAIVRLEQLFPFPADDLQIVIDSYPALQEVVWIQEEPENMGAWTFIQPRLVAMIDGRWPLRYVGRERSASPAEGSTAWHALKQASLVMQAFNQVSEIAPEGIKQGRKT